MTLAEFLLGRISDDEERARILAEAHRNVWGDEVWDAPESPYPDTPSRILADCEANRRIVERCDNYLGDELVADDVLRLLALPYSSHPDYDEAWKP